MSESTYNRLAAISAPVAQRFADIVGNMQKDLTASQLAQWEQHCLHLAQYGWRTWESADAFIVLSPFLIQHLDVDQMWVWAEYSAALASASADVATAFLQSTKSFLQEALLPIEACALWVEGGQWFLRHYAARPSLAADYFRISPPLFGRHTLAACNTWIQLAQALAQLDLKHCQTFFDTSRTLFEQAEQIDLAPAWETARRLVPHAPRVALHYLNRYANLAQHFDSEHLATIHAIIMHLRQPRASDIDTFLRLLASTLSLKPVTERQQTLAWCQQIADVSPPAVIVFLQHLPDLQRRLSGNRLQAWIETGIEVARHHSAAGEAYFAMESATAQSRLQALQKLVVFTDVQRVLQLYTECLRGQRLELRATETSPGQLRTSEHDLPTTDGTAIFVPEQVDDFAAADENLAVYKVAILHQVGFYECGTFRFSMQALQRRTPGIEAQLTVLGGSGQATTTSAFARFFAYFQEPELARRLFTILEDARIDADLSRRYRGIRSDLERLMRHSLQQRPALHDLSLRHALLEAILQLSLGRALADIQPAPLRTLLRLLTPPLQRLMQSDATVCDTAVAVVTCYRLITAAARQAAATFSAVAEAHLERLAAQLDDDANLLDIADLFRQAGEGADVMPTFPDSSEPAEGIAPVPYRGETKPDLIEQQFRLQDLTEQLEQLQDALSPISPEVLKELLERGDIDITSIQAGDLNDTSGLFVADLEGREGMSGNDIPKRTELEREIEALRAELADQFGELSAERHTVLYDEWDYQINDYRKDWCRLTETVLDEDDTAFVEATRQKHADLLSRIIRQFQMLKPEMFKKVKRLVDGEEIDLDSAIEAIVDRHAGNVLSDRVYMRRNKRDRSVAALFLLDMSASTDDEVKEPESATPPPASPAPVASPYNFSGFIREDYYAPLPSAATDKPQRRIIDVEKETLVLMAEGLQTLGDDYAVYGFSGYGRDQVDFYIAKEFTDAYDARTQGRISAIKPYRSTRMGPAIRHAISKLNQQDARIKTLLLLSDGYPQDYDYGKDRKSKDYGIQDTMMALHEAHLKGIQTFCITVDPAGHDYLREMCPDQNYLVIEDIEALPNELPKIYRGLTT
jgi:nitric oxide reductase NorD protein